MRHLSAIIVKTFMVAFVLLIIMSLFYNYPIGDTFALAIIIIAASYIIGDIGILRFTNNTVATLADLGLTTLAIWLIGPFLYGVTVPLSVAFINAVVIAVGEYFFHKFVSNRVLEGEKDPVIHNR
ncbi:DUF2512 family protein [Halalkalibacter urbisdiaboli]|uniref:DUF2512 family protein n=1 Tax=Halalkalibacter urbisdiaboli TaxID=1960589 RepID=UPI000B44CFF2|nr:DUF2512 family protein [Halalkalibacter urbisdiaboli]